MVEQDEKLAALVADFHRCWDDFPGLARLIDSQRRVLAANEKAAAAGFVADCICAAVPTANNHRNCLAARALACRRGMGSVEGGLMRYWLPVEGEYGDEYFVHLSLRIG